MKRFAKFAPLGAIALAAVIAAAPQSVSALNLTFNGPDVNNTNFLTVDTSEKPGDTLAGPFRMQGDTDPFIDEFIAWCFEIGPALNQDAGGQAYTVENFLTSDALGRVQKVFDANYHDPDIQTSQPKGAAFQLAIWEAIYETTEPTLSLASGSFSSNAPTTATGNVREFADTYLNAANTYDGSQKWVITQFKADGAQNLGTATAIPLPAAAWLLLGVSGALVAAKRRSARKAT